MATTDSLKEKPLRVLISGGGIAGPSLAFWLTRLGHACTIVERSSQLRASGQQIDLREQGVEAADRMGLLDDLRKIAVDEAGLQFVDTKGKAFAVLPKVEAQPGQDKGKQSFSSEFEIMRGDMCQLLYEKTCHSTEYMFGKYVTEFQNHEDGVSVTFSDGDKAEYDMLVAADGQSSRIRRMILKDEDPSVDYSRDMGVYLCYFTIPRQPSDTNMASVHITTGQRILCTRFHSETQGQGYLGTMAHADQMKKVLGQDAEAQKALFADLFRDAGWQSERLLKNMLESHDFYAQSMVQIRSKIWSKGRVVFLGDAGYGPTPLTGMGTSLALIGAHILAGEIAKCPEDPVRAFAAYETVLRPYVETTQDIPFGVPGVLYPKTAWGVKILQLLLSLFMLLKLNKLLQLSMFSKEGWKLPHYPQLKL
ncbi:hypothetical protein E4U55_004026 [Claviceps digitariae]|nr:hypothetical protein E4U55_004026 [Claviceps digitariae]